jgi:hypothetical protein
LDIDWGQAGAAITAFAACAGMVGWVYDVRSIAVSARDDLADLIKEREEDKKAYDLRLAKAEQAAISMERLADAVKYGSEATAKSIENLAGKVAEHATFAKEQFSEIRHEQKNVRMALNGVDRQARDRG